MVVDNKGLHIVGKTYRLNPWHSQMEQLSRGTHFALRSCQPEKLIAGGNEYVDGI